MQCPPDVMSLMPPISPTSVSELTKDSAFSLTVRLPKGNLEVANAISRRFVVHSLLPKATPRCKKQRIATLRVHIPRNGLRDPPIEAPGTTMRSVSRRRLEPSCELGAAAFLVN